MFSCTLNSSFENYKTEDWLELEFETCVTKNHNRINILTIENIEVDKIIEK